MRYWNFYPNHTISTLNLRLYPAYEVLKLPVSIWDPEIVFIGLYPAYEVLKHLYRSIINLYPNWRFVSSLWGIETACSAVFCEQMHSLYPAYEVLKHYMGSYLGSKWRPRLYPAYEVLKQHMLFDFFKLFKVCIQPMRYWNRFQGRGKSSGNLKVCIQPMRYWNTILYTTISSSCSPVFVSSLWGIETLFGSSQR